MSVSFRIWLRESRFCTWFVFLRLLLVCEFFLNSLPKLLARSDSNLISSISSSLYSFAIVMSAQRAYRSSSLFKYCVRIGQLLFNSLFVKNFGIYRLLCIGGVAFTIFGDFVLF